MSYQPRYAQFVRVNGEGRMMHEFIAWVRRKWIKWAAEHGKKWPMHPTEEDHRAFDAWLANEGS